jgi:hypothetical protein
MIKRNTKLILLLVVLYSFNMMAQAGLEKTLKGYTAPDELVSLSANIPFSRAIALIDKISEKKTGRKILSLVNREDPIGVEIVNVPYEKALFMIVQYAGLVWEQREDATVIKSKIETKVEIKPETYSDIEGREVKISAIFFDMDVNIARERGINWQFLLSNKSGSIGTGVTSTSTTSNIGTTSSSSTTSDYAITGSTDFGLGDFFGQVSALFRYFETQKVGNLIACPSITVRDRVPGKIQVGSDFSLKQKDFAGNVTDNFFSTGSIIKVTPYVYEQDGLEYVLLDLDVERSSGYPAELSTEIKKTSAKTQVLMLNGEETVIGGLYQNEESTTRSGIPVLKDLPWWVFGIRYLTGSDVISIVKKELVIVIKVELLPKLKERFAFPSTQNPVSKELKTNRDKVKIYQLDAQESTSLPKEK